jgi:hypothetical protein
MSTLPRVTIPSISFLSIMAVTLTMLTAQVPPGDADELVQAVLNVPPAVVAASQSAAARLIDVFPLTAVVPAAAAPEDVGVQAAQPLSLAATAAAAAAAVAGHQASEAAWLVEKISNASPVEDFRALVALPDKAQVCVLHATLCCVHASDFIASMPEQRFLWLLLLMLRCFDCLGATPLAR